MLVRIAEAAGRRILLCFEMGGCHETTRVYHYAVRRNKNNFIAFGSLDGSLRFPMLRLAMAVAALLLAATYAQAQTAKHSFSGLCAYYPGRGGGLTAAHKTLPFGTRVRVTDSKTGRSVIVVINDRGPFNKGRVLDLSAAAAKALGMMERGVVLVRANVL
jgi:rare lipoprotein A